MRFLTSSWQLFAAHAADIGRAVLLAAIPLAVLVLASEALRPGVVGAAVPPDFILGVAALALALSLLSPDELVTRSYLGTMFWAVIAGVAVGWSVFAYFSSSPFGGTVAWWLSIAAVLVAVSLIVAARHAE